MAKFNVLLHFVAHLYLHTQENPVPNTAPSMTKVKNLVWKRLCWLTGCLPRQCAICVSLFVLLTPEENGMREITSEVANVGVLSHHPEASFYR